MPTNCCLCFSAFESRLGFRLLLSNESSSLQTSNWCYSTICSRLSLPNLTFRDIALNLCSWRNPISRDSQLVSQWVKKSSHHRAGNNISKANKKKQTSRKCWKKRCSEKQARPTCLHLRKWKAVEPGAHIDEPALAGLAPDRLNNVKQHAYSRNWATYYIKVFACL